MSNLLTFAALMVLVGCVSLFTYYYNGQIQRWYFRIGTVLIACGMTYLLFSAGWVRAYSSGDIPVLFHQNGCSLVYVQNKEFKVKNICE